LKHRGSEKRKSTTSDDARLLNSANPLFNAHTPTVKQREVSECTRGETVFNNFSTVLNKVFVCVPDI
jgi:hypothetical protein